MDTWRRELKSRLRDVVRDADPQRAEGSQVKLAKKLGGGVRPSQVSDWCSDKREVVPGAENLHRLREECGVDLNWLLSGPERPVPGGWTAERRRKLGEELNSYGLQIVLERMLAKRLPLWATRSVWVAVRGDFLGFLRAEVWRLTDVLCRQGPGAVQGSEKERAELFRRFGAAVKRGPQTATSYVRRRVKRRAPRAAARRAGVASPSGSRKRPRGSRG